MEPAAPEPCINIATKLRTTENWKRCAGCLAWIILPTFGLTIGWSAGGIWLGIVCMFVLGIVGFWILMWLTRERAAALFGCATLSLLCLTAVVCVTVQQVNKAVDRMKATQQEPQPVNMER